MAFSISTFEDRNLVFKAVLPWCVNSASISCDDRMNHRAFISCEPSLANVPTLILP